MWFGYGNDISSLDRMFLIPIDEDSDQNQKNNYFVLHETDRIESNSLRGYLDSKLLASRRNWNIVISADELKTDAKYNFIIDYWNTGHPRYIDITGTSLATIYDWIGVVLPAGVIPIEFINGNNDFREFSAIFKECDGSL
jgi:hypothetical protein